MNTPQPNSQDLWGQLTAWLNQLSPTEQLGLKCLGGLAALGLFVLLVVNPIQQIWLRPSDEGTRLALEIQELQRLQGQVQTLRAQTRMSPEDARKALEKVTKNLLPQAQWAPAQDAVQITFSAVSAPTLARWLMAMRESAQCTVIEADLRQSTPQGTNAAKSLGGSTVKDPVLWQGRLMVGLPH